MISLTLLVGVAIGVCCSRRKIQVPYLFFLFIFFVALNFISVFWALNAAHAVVESSRTFIFAYTVIFLFNVLKNSYAKTYFLKSVVLFIGFITILVGISICSKIGCDFQIGDIQLIFGHRNLLASFLFLSLVVCFIAMEVLAEWKYFNRIIISFLILEILLLQNRASIIACIIFLAISIIYYKKEILVNGKKIMIIASSIISVALIGYFAILETNKNDISQNGTFESINERINVWQNTQALITDYPLFGVGAGNWQFEYSKYSVNHIKNVRNSAVTFQRPHNDLLWVLAELGVFGFALVLITGSLILYKAIKNYRITKNKVVGIATAGLIAFLVISLFSFTKERFTHLLMVGVVIVVLLGELRLKQMKIENKYFHIFCLPIIILLIFVSFYQVRGEYFTQKLLVSQKQGDVVKVIEFGNKATSYFYSTDPTSTPISSYIGWSYYMLGDFDNALIQSKKAYLIAPYDFQVITNYAMILARQNDFVLARKLNLKAYELNHYHIPALVNLFTLEYNCGNYEESLKWIKMIPNYQDVYQIQLNKINEKLYQK